MTKLIAHCRGGETGRHARLKIWWGQPRVGSSPTLGIYFLMEALK